MKKDLYSKEDKDTRHLNYVYSLLSQWSLHNNIQLLVFEEHNIKIYRSVKGDIDRREAEVSISFHKLINLDICSSNTSYCFITFLCPAYNSCLTK